ncbi:Arylsulfatase [Caulifigura coniformis]|uniref:Arylsulfatase n=1 Tax=Caulifigura coniformis TaxID=2527983 RepID=A0A517S894_9PLAN|nr:sulfatase [Caulifigura coniformis]QDT52332.1 Arylsulfatase [Caulifigura coniformis]
MRSLLACLVVFAVTFSSAAVAQERLPNLIIINCDDLGYGDVGCYGSTKQKTPNIDRLAAEGMKLTSFYSTSGVCTPSRTSLMTGCYPRRVSMHTNGVGYWVLFPGNARGLHPDETTIAEVAKSKGYATMCIGKWHLGDQPAFLPTKQGFDHYFGIPFSNDMGQLRADGKMDNTRLPTPLMRDETVIEQEPDQTHLTRRYTNEAVSFMEKNVDRPFFLYLPHAFPHWPHYASEKFKGKSANGVYGDCIEEVDWSTGIITRALVDMGLDRHTIVLFTSDNGGVFRHGASNAPLKAGKATSFEGGHRVPGILWAPGRIKAGQVGDKIVTMMDILPTFAATIGAPLPERKIDGYDQRPLLNDPSARSPYDESGYLYYFEGYVQAVRSGAWKLRVAKDGPKQTSVELDRPELYNLDQDPGESTNVADQNPEIIARLLPMIEKARHEIGHGDKDGTEQRKPGLVDNPTPLTRRAS